MHQTASTTIIRTNKCFLVAQKKDALCLSNLSEQIARQWCAWTTLVGDTGSNSSCRHREGKKTQCGTSVLWQWKSTQEKIRLFCFKHVKPIHLLKKTRWSLRTRMLTRMLMVQMSKHMVMQSRTISCCNSLYLNSLVHVSLVTSLQCGVESVECGVWSVKWSKECGV